VGREAATEKGEQHMIDYSWNDSVLITSGIMFDKQFHPNNVPLEFDAFVSTMAMSDKDFVDAVTREYTEMVIAHKKRWAENQIIRKDLADRYTDFE
jgi:hypothetical protein